MPMDYLIRLIQVHETFRRAETDALAELNGLKIQWLSYSDEVRMQQGEGPAERDAT